MFLPRPVTLLKTIQRRTATAALALAGALTPAVAHAVPATAADFQIRYWTVDDDGDTRAMTQQDLQQFVNAARCECNQLIRVQITLQSASGQAFDQDRIRAFAGSNCASGQAGVGMFNDRCVVLDDLPPSGFTTGPIFEFPMIWLSSGIASSDAQTLGEATPKNSCDSGVGEGGIWICVENGTQSECQAEEFIIQGTQNQIVTTQDPTMGGSSGAIIYDYQPPQSLPVEFSTAGGDGAVVVSWDAQSSGDLGYRVLCADADGNPLPQHGTSGPNVGAENQGQIYFTPTNLCPDGPFDSTPEGTEDNPEGEDDGGTDDGGTDDGGTDDGGTTGFGADWGDNPEYGSPFAGGGTASMTSDSGSTSGGDFTTSGDSSTSGATTGTGGDTGGDSTSGSGSSSGGELPSSGIESLDWAYVCSGHIASNGASARIEDLENDTEYQFLVVAYDVAGNPIAASEVLSGTPRETTDLWEQCEAAGGICGEGGFCNCSTDGDLPPVPTALFALIALGMVRRRSGLARSAS